MTSRELEEYRALRATIRERGTARVSIAVAGFAAWAALVLTTATLATFPVATLLPLLFLALVFEAVFALHTGVERIGRVGNPELSEAVATRASKGYPKAVTARADCADMNAGIVN